MLAPGARIAVIAPSGQYDPARLHRGIGVASAWGYRLEPMPNTTSRWRYLAGDDDTRLADLHRAFGGEYDAVWMARGGYGLARLLPRIDWARLAPVPLIGFSDGTALLNALAARGRPAVHAPVLHNLAEVDASSQERLRSILAGEPVAPLLSGLPDAPIRGGNLCVLASLCGTPFQLDARDCLVLLEDLGEVPYKLDRLLTQLVQSGSLAGAVGLVCGEFMGASSGEDWSLESVFHDAGLPVWWGAPVGHGGRNYGVRFDSASGSKRVQAPAFSR